MNIYSTLQDREPSVDWFHDFDSAYREYEVYLSEIEKYAEDLSAYIKMKCRQDYNRSDI